MITETKFKLTTKTKKLAPRTPAFKIGYKK